MPVIPARRKTHSKSRKGCLQCKKRHTKCNEEHPQCANCIRLEITCEWPPPRARVQHASPQSTGLGPSPMSRENSYIGSPLPTPSVAARPTFTLEDMQLLHHWTTRVYLFHDPTSDDEKWVWSEGIVNVAFQHQFLLHGILAFSALHKTLVDSQGNRASLLAQADAHMSTSLATYLRLLEENALETVVPCFLLSSICFAYNLATAQVEEPEDPLGAILHCFRLLRGVKVAIGQHWEQLQQNDIIGTLLGPVRFVGQLPLPEDTECTPLLDLKLLADQFDTPQKGICLEAIENLHKTFVKTTLCSSLKQEHSIIMTWPALLSTEFLDLCQARNHVGVLIITYWAVLLARNTGAWWLNGWLVRLIHACEELLAPIPELMKWLDWPIEMSKHRPARLATLCSTRPSPMELTHADGTTPVNTPPPNTHNTTEAYQGPAQP
ncbi:hypothetical protein BU25DRAFT_46104 [Macroventuria anomochaeta]|uniref:Uncharacterized protein n=1 Tax=Macroventuria anomochaeta TaxID=301207 RepID=A0ACB6S3E8_9PLEO|nr:uncharacterized protein BU25DRAFT_46104 [Macroventuria anomochaeta]KAF2627893.1 hypothetical protein BU25DRAFT_46104 [Macroventuria anomochaeta]